MKREIEFWRKKSKLYKKLQHTRTIDYLNILKWHFNSIIFKKKKRNEKKEKTLYHSLELITIK